ncbi:MAG: replication initiation protein [Ruminococcus sp.]|nr:replication initiation protein [Ruminococcus sp.]
MPKRVTLPSTPDYIGIPEDINKLIVQKSNPLKSLSETGMTLSEFKILDAYLSRIDSRIPEKRSVRFEKGELEKLLGVERIRKEDLNARLDGLFKTVTIKDKDKENGFTKIGLFEKAEAKQDEYGLWQVDLVCTPSAMEYIFNVEIMGYLPYMLKNIIELTSRYSYVLYLYLEARRKGLLSNEWEVDVDELKRILQCNSSMYDEFKEFNRLLKKCHYEINEKTDLKFSYYPRRKGRRVKMIQFSIETPKKELSCDKSP